MGTKTLTQGIIKLDQENYLPIAVQSFLLDRKIQNLQGGTIDFYRKKLGLFLTFADSQAVNQVKQVDPDLLRNFILWLQEKNHTPGGISCYYRSLRTFIRWWIAETESDDYKNPFLRVKAPKIGIEPLEPISTDEINKLIKSCGNNFTGRRDAAIIFFLLETGVRASEALSISLDDLNLLDGSALIRSGKGRKPRYVYLGKRCRKVVREYLKMRNNNNLALWVTDDQMEKLSYWGLKGIMKRRAKIAGIPCPQIHAFRRSFALSMLRQGVDIVSISKMMGHADLQVLTRYLKQTNEDLKFIHNRNSPVDKL